MTDPDEFVPQRLEVWRDTHEDVVDKELVAAGVQFPSGEVVVEWRRGAFPKGERTEHPTQSHYGSLEDAKQGTSGEIVATDDPFERASELEEEPA